MAENPILLICRAIPEEEVTLTNEFLDKMHLMFSATNIHHSKDRDECYQILKMLEELDLIVILPKPGSNQLLIKQSTQTKEILQYYGK